MIRLYVAALLGAAIFLSYFIGGHVVNIKCGARVAKLNSEQIITNTKIMEQINDAAVRTGVGNIRSILREKYTIAE